MYFGHYAVNAILYVILDSEVFSPIRGYIEARFPKSKLEYLINCPYCLSYWISLFISFLFLLTCFLDNLFNSSILVILTLSLFVFLVITGQQIQKIKKDHL